MKINSEILHKRLAKRRSNDFGRNEKVQKWILSWKKWWEKHMKERGAITIDANGSLKEIANEILNKI